MHSIFCTRRASLWPLLILSLALGLHGSNARAEWDDASGMLDVLAQSPRYFDRVNRSLFSEVTLQNTSGQALDGLFRLVIADSSIDVKDADGFTGTGEPYMDFEATRLAAGEQVRVRVSFERQRGTLTYSVRPEWISQSNSPDPNDPVEPPVENQPPAIVECAAPATAQVGVLYDYTPVFLDNDGDALTYSTDFRQPPWTDFDTATGRLYGTPAPGDIGTYQYIKIFASDGSAETKCGGFRIKVENTAPEIGGTPPTTATALQPYSFTPTATDINGDVLTFSITNKPAWADFDTATGRLSGTPTRTAIGGSDEIQIKVTDGRATTALTPFTITVANQLPELFPPEQPPPLTAAQGEQYLYWPGTIDRDGDPLLFQAPDGLPRWLSLDSVTGSLRGTPGAADVGPHRIRITVSDYRDTVQIADYVLNVTNGAPVFNNAPPTVVDAGHPYAFTPDVADPDGATLGFSLINGPAWLAIDPATGTLAGTPTQDDLGLWEQLDLCASDGVATTCVGAFDIEVRNQAPSIAGTPATTIEVGQGYGFTPTAGDNNGDTLTFGVTNLPEWAGFDPATGTLAGNPAEIDIRLWPDIRISVSDGIATTSLPAFDIEVLPDPTVPLNTPPTIGGSPAMHVRVGADYAFVPVANDADGDPLSFEIENLPAWAAFDAGTGALTGTPTPADADTLFADILITVSDGVDSVSLPAFDIQVETGNRAPSIEGVPETRVEIGSAYVFVPSAADEDGDDLRFEIDNQPAWAGFDPGTGALSGTPAVGDEGLYEAIVIRVADGTVSTALPAFSILVETAATPNQAPDIGGTPGAAARVGRAYGFTPDATDPEHDPLTFSVVNLPAWADFDEQTGTLSGTPGPGDIGEYPGIGISVSDGELSASLAPFTIAVAENHAPVIDGNPPSSTNAGQLYSFTPTASDPDADPLTFEIKNQPGWADFDPATGTLSGVPTQADVMTWRYIKIGASDGQITSWFGNFTIPVRNQAPEVGGTPDASVAIGGSYRFVPTASDPNGDPIAGWEIENLPAWAGFDPTTGALTGTPGLADAGNHDKIRIGANDGLTTGWLPRFTITVLNQAPEIGGSMPGDAPIGQPYSFTPVASDADGHDLTFVGRNLPAWLSLDPATGALSGTPTRDDQGSTWYVSIGASDGFATSYLPNIVLKVTNQAPEISGTPPTVVDVGQSYSFTPTVSDNNGDPMSFSISGQPSWATFDPATGTLTGDPANDDIRNWKGIRITVTDGLASTTLSSFDIRVDAANTAPVITGHPPALIAPGRNYRFTPAARDMDSDDVLTFSVQNLPGWAVFDPDTGTLAGVPAAGDLGSLTTGVVISVSDGDASASLDPVDIEVVAAYDEVDAALATGDVLHVTDVNDLIDAALAELGVQAQLGIADAEALTRMLENFRHDAFNFDWTDCRDKGSCNAVEGFNAEFLDGAKIAGKLLAGLDRAKVDLFAEPDRRLEKLLLLLGDHYAQRVRFPMHKDETDPVTLVQSLYSEYAVYNSRPLNHARPDPGTFGSADFRWATPEDIDLALVSRKNFRAAGVYAFPGETFSVTRLDDSPVTTQVFINTIRPNAGRMWEHGYTRPNLLRSESYPLAPGETLSLTSAIGGPVQIGFDGNDEVVELRFEHVGRHPVWRSSADSASFVATILESQYTWQRYNWVEFLTPYFEIHARLPTFIDALAWPGGADALPDAISGYYHNLARGLAGYQGEGIVPIAEVAAVADANGWQYRIADFMGHANTDKATCGTACSGNPWDTGRHFNPIGHGALHELGHTMQGGVRFEGWSNHTMTNHYSMYTKKAFYNDTGLTTVLGDWVCWKGSEPAVYNESQRLLFEIVQQSVHEPDPAAYVRAQLSSAIIEDPDDEEVEDDLDETFAVNEALAGQIYNSLKWMAQYNGALADGDHLRTLVHLVVHNHKLATRDEASWLAMRDTLGMGQYSLAEAKAIDNNDLQLIAMSYATGLDYREPYDMFGIRFSAKASAQVAALGLYPLPRELRVPDYSQPACPLGHPGNALPADGSQVWPLP